MRWRKLPPPAGSTPGEALASGGLRVDGPEHSAKRLRLFPMPEPCMCESEAAAQAS